MTNYKCKVSLRQNNLKFKVIIIIYGLSLAGLYKVSINICRPTKEVMK